MQETSWEKSSLGRMFALVFLCVFCLGLQNRVQGEVGQEVFTLRGLRIPKYRGRQDKGTYSQFTCIEICSLLEN